MTMQRFLNLTLACVVTALAALAYQTAHGAEVIVPSYQEEKSGTSRAGIGVSILSGTVSVDTSSIATAAKQTDGTQKTQIVDGTGNVIGSTSNSLKVQCNNCSGIAGAADQSAFTAGSSLAVGSGMIYQSVQTANPLTTGTQGVWQGTAYRAGHVNLRNASGVEIGTSTTPLSVTLANTGANATAVKVDGSAVTQPVSGTFWQATQPVSGNFYQATQPVSATSLPLPAGAATSALQSSLQTALGTPFQAGGSIGNTSFAATQATAANLNATVVGTGTFAVQAAQTGTWNVNNIAGTISLPSGAATSANQSSEITSLAAIQTSMGYLDARNNYANFVRGTTSSMTGTTSTSLIAAPGASLFNYITQLTCVNSHATVGTLVSLQDGSGGTTFYTVAAASSFGGTVISFPVPLKQPTVNTALYVANVTTGAAVICSANGYKGL